MAVPSERLELLRRWQNSDGGWGYFPGKRSWLEPTVYAAAALKGEPASDKAFTLVQSWAMKDGGWRTSADVGEANWTSALALHWYAERGIRDHAYERGVHLLLRTLGIEGSALTRTGNALRGSGEMDVAVFGWPWLAGCASWVEPTVHSLLALRRLAPRLQGRALTIAGKRIRMAESMLCDRQCADGGWNYGNRRVLEENLPSYPETTGLAMIGLSGAEWPRRTAALRRLTEYAQRPVSPLAIAWIRLATRVNGVPGHSTEPAKSGNDVVLQALLACGESEEQWRFFHA